MRPPFPSSKTGMLAVRDLGALLQSKGMSLSYPAVVVEVCSPRHAKTVLEAHPPISNALPCRIAIYGRDGETTIETLPPTMLLAGFGKTGLEPVAQEVETLLKEIIEAAV